MEAGIKPEGDERAWKSELFTKAMNHQLGGTEDESFVSAVPMPDHLVQAFADHAGQAVRNGGLRLGGGDFESGSDAMAAHADDTGDDPPFSLDKDPRYLFAGLDLYHLNGHNDQVDLYLKEVSHE